MKRRDDAALAALSKIRRVDIDTEILRSEYLAVKAEVLFEEDFANQHYPGKSGLRLAMSQYYDLVSTKPAFHRLAVGCCVMFFQQFVSSHAARL